MIDVKTLSNSLASNINRVIVGKQAVVIKAIATLLAGGHILFEDVPGVGKTVFCRALAKSISGSFARLQCTPDVLPADILGVTVYHQDTHKFVFNRGPVFNNIFLTDEINRATPKTQSALLECMEEHQVTTGGLSIPLPNPFVVIATQNPVEYEGTFPLPEAQLDRFAVKLNLGYPSFEAETSMLRDQHTSHPLESLNAVCTLDSIIQAMLEIRKVVVSEPIINYIVALVNATRNENRLLLGASPRASQTLYRTSQALAAINGRSYVLPDDVKNMAIPVLGHRLLVSFNDSLKSEDIIKDILSSVPVS